jgi:DNA-binding XRE family transcriptional regulator
MTAVTDSSPVAREHSTTTVTSVFRTLRPCVTCGTEFYPPKRPDRRIADHCGERCESAAGLRAAERCYRTAGSVASVTAPSAPRPRITVVARPRLRAVREIRTVRSRFGANIRTLRRANGWTQQEVADRLDVVRESVRRWELDQGDPSAAHVHRLARLFGVSMDDLWSGTVAAGTRTRNIAAGRLWSEPCQY